MPISYYFGNKWFLPSAVFSTWVVLVFSMMMSNKHFSCLYNNNIFHTILVYHLFILPHCRTNFLQVPLLPTHHHCPPHSQTVPKEYNRILRNQVQFSPVYSLLKQSCSRECIEWLNLFPRSSLFKSPGMRRRGTWKWDCQRIVKTSYEDCVTVCLFSYDLWTYRNVAKKKKMINGKKQPNSDEQISPLKFLIC